MPVNIVRLIMYKQYPLKSLLNPVKTQQIEHKIKPKQNNLNDNANEIIINNLGKSIVIKQPTLEDVQILYQAIMSNSKIVRGIFKTLL